LLVPVKDPPALMAAIVELWENGELRARLGSAARDRVQKSFSLDACVQKYLNLYSGIARRENGPIENLIGSG
jgi:glycosyltransferase involved in cell wall biosynthesis